MSWGELGVDVSVWRRLTSRFTRRTLPAASATSTEEGEEGSATAATILDFRVIGLPNLLADLALRCSLCSMAALGWALVHVLEARRILRESHLLGLEEVPRV